MQNRLWISSCALVLTGCAAGSGSPGRLPENARAGIYSAGQPQVIAACIAGVVQNAARPTADRLVIDSVRHPGVSYSVGANDDPVYATQIAVIGDAGDTPEAKRAGLCASAGVVPD